MKSHLQHWVCQKLDEDKQNPQKKHTKKQKTTQDNTDNQREEEHRSHQKTRSDPKAKYS